MDAVVRPRQFGLLRSNPPYGDLVTDLAAASAARWMGRERLEKLFYERTVAPFQFVEGFGDGLLEAVSRQTPPVYEGQLDPFQDLAMSRRIDTCKLPAQKK